MRSSTGPFLALLGASGTAVGIIAGAGELFGYLLRLVSGRFAERTRLYWPITLAGYILQMSAVPLLGLSGNWMIAALIIVLERTGKAIRNPTANFMMSRAGEHIGQGWAFGLQEALELAAHLAAPLRQAGKQGEDPIEVFVERIAPVVGAHLQVLDDVHPREDAPSFRCL